MQILAAFKSWWRRTFGPAPAVPAGTGLPEPLERRALVRSHGGRWESVDAA